MDIDVVDAGGDGVPFFVPTTPARATMVCGYCLYGWNPCIAPATHIGALGPRCEAHGDHPR